MVGRFLHGMPTRPVLYLAPVLVIIVLILYYGGNYRDCQVQAGLRAELLRQASDRLGQSFNLTQFTPYAWNQAFLVSRYRDVRGVPNCPFGWNWADAQYRQQLLEQQKLGVLVFVKEKELVGYIEMDLTKIDIVLEPERALSPEQAVFKVERATASDGALAGGLLLIPVDQEPP